MKFLCFAGKMESGARTELPFGANSVQLDRIRVLPSREFSVCCRLQKTGWKIKGADGAAELLGIKPTTLLSRIKKMGLQKTR